MALNDSQLIFDSNASLAIAAGSQPSQLVIDLMGGGVGTAPVNFFGVQSAVAGEDIGVGDGASPPVLQVIIGTTFTSGGSATLQVQLQASVDSGATGTPPYSPNAWKTLLQTDTLPVSVLTAGTKIAECTWPPRYPGQAFPRFLRLNYIVGTATMTAGTIAIANINTGRDDNTNTIYPAGY